MTFTKSTLTPRQLTPGYTFRTSNEEAGEAMRAARAQKAPVFVKGVPHLIGNFSCRKGSKDYSGRFQLEPHTFAPGEHSLVVNLDKYLVPHPLAGELADTLGCKWMRQRYIGPFPPCPPTAFDVKLNFDLSGTVTGRDESTPEAPKPQWDGTGLPPVGADFEVLWDTDSRAYMTARAVGRDGEKVVFRFTSGDRAGEYQAERPITYNSGTLPNFRPIKTAEQLEAEKRAAEIDRMVGACTAGRYAPTVRRKVCENLYDAGVRFSSEGK